MPALLLDASAGADRHSRRRPEAKVNQVWVDVLATLEPQVISRPASLATGWAAPSPPTTRAAAAGAPPPAPYPVQRGPTAPMCAAAARKGDIGRMQAWTGQAGFLATTRPAGNVVREIWRQASTLLP